MKKTYLSPIVECMAFCSETAMANDSFIEGGGSEPWNDGELNWT